MKNFGLIQEGYIKLMQEGLEENDKQKQRAFKKYIKTIKSSPILQKQKNIFKLLEQVNSVDSEFIEMYLNEAINILSDVDENTIISENIKLLSPLMEFKIDLNKMDYEEKSIHESITDYLYLPRTPKAFNKLIECKHQIINFKPTNELIIEDESKIIPPSMINKLMVSTITTKYPDLSLLEVKVIASIVNNDENEQRHLFESLLTECQEVIDEMLENNEFNEIHEDLKTSKDKLNSMNFVNESYFDDIFELIELKDLTTI